MKAKFVAMHQRDFSRLKVGSMAYDRYGKRVTIASLKNGTNLMAKDKEGNQYFVGELFIKMYGG